MLSTRPHSQSNLYVTGKKFFELIDITAGDDELKARLEKHPDFPSLLSLKDVFLNFGVKSGAVKSESASLADFKTPFICPIKKDGWDYSKFTIINDTDNGLVTFYDTLKLRWEKVSLEMFTEWHTGVVLLAEKDGSFPQEPLSKSKTISSSKAIIKVFGSIFLASVFFSILFNFQYNASQFWFISSFLILNVIGVSMSTLIIWYEVDKHNPLLRSICSIGKKIDCKSVLQSDGSKIFGINWSTIGFSYFFTNSISVVFFSFSNNYLLTIWIALSIITSPYVLYSIIYQWKIARQWCLLCLSIQSILLCQLLLGISNWTKIDLLFDVVGVYQVVMLAILFSLVLTATFSYITILKKARESDQYQQSWQDLRSDRKIFKALLMSQQPINVSTEGIGIEIGNLQAQHQIIMVSNPYCSPCSIAHSEIINILCQKNNIKLKIIFTASLVDNDVRTPPVRHLVALDNTGDRIRINKALDDWYSFQFKSYQDFAEAYPIEIDPATIDRKIELMNNWNLAMEIRETPTIYLDGFLLPENYTISDIENFI